MTISAWVYLWALETTLMFIKRGMEKEAVVHIYNGILLSYKRNEIGLFAVMWVDLESVIQSEVRKRKRNIMY